MAKLTKADWQRAKNIQASSLPPAEKKLWDEMVKNKQALIKLYGTNVRKAGNLTKDETIICAFKPWGFRVLKIEANQVNHTDSNDVYSI